MSHGEKMLSGTIQATSEPSHPGVHAFMWRSAPNRSPANRNGPRSGTVTASNRSPLPGRSRGCCYHIDEQRRCQRAQDDREQVDVFDCGKQAGDEYDGHDDLGLARRVYAVAGDSDDAEHAEKQCERNTDVPAVEQPVGQRDAASGEQEPGVMSGRAGAGVSS
jgi:hypothetical protein